MGWVTHLRIHNFRFLSVHLDNKLRVQIQLPRKIGRYNMSKVGYNQDSQSVQLGI